MTEWDAFVARHPHGHLLQTAGWAELKSRFGWGRQQLVLPADDGPAAGAQVLYRWFPLNRTPGRLVSLAYVPKGPVVDWANQDQVEAVLEWVTAEARRRRAIWVRIEPHLATGQVEELDALLARTDFVPVKETIQPRRTLTIDISGNEDDILRGMKQKTRYNIRLASRKEVTVRGGAADDLLALARLMQATASRNAFGVHSMAYYRAVLELFVPDHAALLIAEYAGRPLAALIVFALGETAIYMYGASSDDERHRMPTHLLQWEAIRWARSRGCRQYDLWGVPDEGQEALEAGFADRSDGLWGVYRFKRGFGGQLTRWVGAYDRVLNRPLYWLYRAVRRG